MPQSSGVPTDRRVRGALWAGWSVGWGAESLPAVAGLSLLLPGPEIGLKPPSTHTKTPSYPPHLPNFLQKNLYLDVEPFSRVPAQVFPDP